MQLSRFQLYMLKKIANVVVVQGNHYNNIVLVFKTIVDAARREFTEDTPPSLNAFLQECFDIALGLPKKQDTPVLSTTQKSNKILSEVLRKEYTLAQRLDLLKGGSGQIGSIKPIGELPVKNVLEYLNVSLNNIKILEHEISQLSNTSESEILLDVIKKKAEEVGINVEV